MNSESKDVIFFRSETHLCTRKKSSYSGNYIAVNKKLSWVAAEKYCHDQYGSHLATVLTDNDFEKITALWRSVIKAENNMWIGLNDVKGLSNGFNNRDGWQWTSCEPYSQQKYWRNVEPNRVYQDKCAMFWGVRKENAWDNAHCENKKYWSAFACDKPN